MVGFTTPASGSGTLADVVYLGIILAAIVYGFATWRNGSLKALRATNEDLRQRVADLESRERDHISERSKLDGQVTQLTEENHGLRALVMGEKVPKAMADLIISQGEQTRGFVVGLQAAVESVAAAVKQNTGAVLTLHQLIGAQGPREETT